MLGVVLPLMTKTSIFFGVAMSLGAPAQTTKKVKHSSLLEYNKILKLNFLE
jgi:hypothetical protein